MPDVRIVPQIAGDISVICIAGKGFSPDKLDLTDTEREYTRRCLADQPDYVVINSFYKTTFIVPEKGDLDIPFLHEELRKVSVKLIDELRRGKILTVGLKGIGASGGSLSAMAEGLMLSAYTFEKYKGESTRSKTSGYPETIQVESDDQGLARRLETLFTSVSFARDRVNEPLSHLSAEAFADSIASLCQGAGIRVETLTRKQIEALKMGGLIAVNRGSKEPPTFTIAEWNPPDAINSQPIVLVGKGVVFDTGGLNLKPTGYIEDMKADMAGGAAVAAALYYIATMKFRIRVIALIPATDNRPGETAVAPGDVIRMFNGKTVEVLNTDAEGRLILADALSYADRFAPQLVITIATLTGSAANTFGNKAIAAMGTAGEELRKAIESAGMETWERVAFLPFWEDYGELLKSDIADLKNVGGKEAGAITAGKFLGNFTGAPLLHLDIAGTAMLKKEDYYRPRGGTGSGVRLLVKLLEKIESGEVKIENR